MNTGRRVVQVWHMSNPKKVLRLWLWWAPQLHQKIPLAITPAKKGKFRHSTENSKESLIAGELSDGRRSQRCLVQVPKGFLAVYVGPELRRFVIPASYLSMPDFRGLMEKVAEEFGFEQEGGLRIPCEEDDFENILVRCSYMHQKRKKKEDNQRL